MCFEWLRRNGDKRVAADLPSNISLGYPEVVLSGDLYEPMWPRRPGVQYGFKFDTAASAVSASVDASLQQATTRYPGIIRRGDPFVPDWQRTPGDVYGDGTVEPEGP